MTYLTYYFLLSLSMIGYGFFISRILKINYVNIGGGIGIPYKPGEKKVNIEELVNIIYETFTENNFMVPNLFMENGRYITGPYGWLVSKCLCKKLSFDKIFYGLDACMSNLMRPGMYNSYHHITILDKTKPQKNFWGLMRSNLFYYRW